MRKAMPPPIESANNGCTFFSKVFPVVEYLTCPKAESPGNFSITEVFVKWSLTKPKLSWVLKFFHHMKQFLLPLALYAVSMKAQCR